MSEPTAAASPRALEYLRLDQLRPNPRNPKSHDLETIDDSVGRFGYVEPIVHQFINASFRAISNGRVLVDDLENVYETWSEQLTARRGSAARRLLPHLLNQPAVNVAHVESAAGVALSAAQRAVGQLEDAGILKRTSGSRRNRVWIAQDVIDALDAFAERVGRRG